MSRSQRCNLVVFRMPQVRAFVKMQSKPKLFWFCVVGGSTSLCYAIFVEVLIDVFLVSQAIAASIAYLLMLPISFLGHKLLTFRSKERTLSQSFRFFTMHGITALVCAFIMWIMTVQVGTTHWFGSAAIIIIAPAINYIMMEVWVFAKQVE